MTGNQEGGLQRSITLFVSTPTLQDAGDSYGTLAGLLPGFQPSILSHTLCVHPSPYRMRAMVRAHLVTPLVLAVTMTWPRLMQVRVAAAVAAGDVGMRLMRRRTQRASRGRHRCACAARADGHGDNNDADADEGWDTTDLTRQAQVRMYSLS